MNIDPLGDTLVSLFAARVAESGDGCALHARQDAGYRPLAWNELARDVRRAAAVLVNLGVSAGDRVVLVSENRYEWIVCDLAILMARGVHVPIHAALSGPQIGYQIADSGARVVLISGAEQAEKFSGSLPGLGDDVKFVSFDPVSSPRDGRPVPRLADLAAGVDDARAAAIEREAVERTQPGDLATILYTSGTTGEPKGVMLSHRNLVSNACATRVAFELRPDDLRLTWLPLSHIFARTCDLYGWLVTGSELALAENRETILKNCAELQPTLMNGVPYFFDKVQRYLQEQGLADKPGVLAKLLGGRIRLLGSGGAALPDHVAEFFQSRGVLLAQGYGLTESSPVITMSTERDHKIGTVGKAIEGIELRIADDGEVLTRGPHVMLGYWNKPEATAEAVVDGWLRTGDLGSIDTDGHLRITGRKKELIVTAGGKNIAPVLLESLLTEDPLILQAVVIGDGRNYLTALLVPDTEAVRAELPAVESMKSPEVRQLLETRIAERLAGVSGYEQVKNFVVLSRPFTVEAGELTPTLKLRRGVILAEYAEVIEGMYAGG